MGQRFQHRGTPAFSTAPATTLRRSWVTCAEPGWPGRGSGHGHDEPLRRRHRRWPRGRGLDRPPAGPGRGPGGPAGAVTSRKRHGVHARADARGVLQLSRWGLLPTWSAPDPPIRRTLFHYTGEAPVQVSIRRSPGVDALYAPRRHVLDTLLVDAAAAAGVHVVHGVTATALLHHDRRVGGVARTGSGAPSCGGGATSSSAPTGSGPPSPGRPPQQSRTAPPSRDRSCTATSRTSRSPATSGRTAAGRPRA